MALKPYSWIYSVESWNEPIIEVRDPKPGFRHQAGTRLVFHRFPVKGGISIKESWRRTTMKRNVLFEGVEDESI